MFLSMRAEEAMFRSADMTYIELYIPLEIAREVVCVLGNLGSVMLKDMNKDLSTFQRGYVNQVRRFDEVERQVGYMEGVVRRHKNETWRYLYRHLQREEQQEYPGREHPTLAQLIGSMHTHSIDSVDEVAEEIMQFEGRVRQLDQSLVAMRERLSKLVHERRVMFTCEHFLEVNPGIGERLPTRPAGFEADEFELTRVGEEDEETASQLSFDISDDAETQLPGDMRTLLEPVYRHQYLLTGSIERAKVEALNKILWRLLRGNVFFQNFPVSVSPVEEDDTDLETDCFIVFTHGEVLLSKAKKVIESLNGTIYPFMQDGATVQELNDKIADLKQICSTTEQTLHTELFLVANQLPMWNAIIKREKYIYSALNLFRQESQGLVAEGWLPTYDLPGVQAALKDYGESVGSANSAVLNVISTTRTPPTFHRTNKFTQAFQSIVDAYGIATYKEVNPGLATIVTFPFMFAVMFGDAGHGALMLIAALYLVLNEKKLGAMKRGEIFDMAYTGRYVILLMGIFSIYTGIMYNDIFSKSMHLFSTGWKWPSNFQEGEMIEAQKVGVYPFGLDYAWHGSDNSLLFTNSYKMKLSILLGFIHMSYSYIFSYLNYHYKGSRIDIVGNFIPGLIFMQSIFGYLSWAIIYKWSKDWIKDELPAPGLLNMLINMFLSPGVVDEKLYTGQSFLQVILLLAALVCVPWLLLYKPLMLKRQNDIALSKGFRSLRDQRVHEILLEAQENAGEDMLVADYENEDESSEEFNFGDVMIHQVIHTIEFCLNCISHTASYLRLWALSLAHAQLSTVLWSMTIQNSFSDSNPGSFFSVTKVVVLFAMWFVLTVCILVLMEGTSAMLHSLRLHWVEAMSKFFEGEGYAYEPFSFKAINSDDE
ncbi:ADR127Wp [Eremothecium gossypii ATCC 10895]|uniref:V-type proton ATPase subunit a n=1 Tax=Eremothecium gossypii (strain ATCC 10895 / CBS 109.51 / FGSC 9923 / NRRL Y-1056) TaxID=284811 RepID=Q759Z6_EREGS|nr:ADR127Wp [Eremothecium gossypii ATCC 10895]AAS52047.2 ADR127Wp [Eremothecium gossypii ATCC 10895]AEY96347.1 FADR127Wp [Eremothecium gossypii FDAG1]